MSMSYAQMVEGCRKHDPKAQRALYDEVAPMAMGVCTRYSSSADEARDLLQDGLIKVFEHISTLRDPQKLRSWTYNIMVNTCIQHHRKTRHLMLDEDMDTYTDDDNSLPYTMDEIVDAMQTLTAAQRTVFNLCCIEGMEFEAVAQKLRCSPVNVRAQLSKARSRMRKHLEKINSKN